MGRQRKRIDIRGLVNAYRNVKKDGLVLFVDETYLAPQDNVGATPFYTICGVLLPLSDLEAVREDIREVVGEATWHTTEILHAGDARRVVQFLEYCAAYPDVYVFAHRIPILPGEDLESARQACIRALLAYVVGHHPMLDLVVFEERRRESQDRDDLRTINELRQAGKFPRSIRCVFASPAIENLLWMPDLLAMAHRRMLTHSGKDDTAHYFDRYVRQNAVVIEVDPECQ